MIYGRASTLRTQRLLGSGDGERFEAEGRDPALLVFHGYTGTTSELRPLIDRVAARGYAVRAPLMPGHGTLPHELQDVRFDDLVAFARAELEDVKKRHARIVVAGFSYGSLVAMNLAASADDAPWLAGVVLMGNAVTLPIYSRGPLGLAARLGGRLPDAYLMKLGAADMRDRVEARRISTYDRQPLRAALEVYLAGKRERARAHSIRCPALILHGAFDRVCPATNAAWLARRIGSHDVTVRVYARSGHILAADHDRDAVAHDVLAFLDRIATT